MDYILPHFLPIVYFYALPLLMKPTAFLKSFSGLVLLNVLIKPVWIFGIDRKLQVLVGHEEYGTYFSILSLSIVLSFLADAGITNMLNRQLALQQPVHLGSLLRAKWLLVLLYGALVAIIAALSGVQRWDIVILVCAIQVGTSFLLFYRNILTGHQRFSTDAWVSVLDKLLMIVVAAPFLYPLLGPVHILLHFFLSLQVATVFTIVLIAYALNRKYLKGEEASSTSLKDILQLTLPFTVLVLLMSVHNRLDAFLLERLHPNGAYQAGVYATAYRLLDAGSTVGYLAASFLLPYVSRHMNQDALVHEIVFKLRHLLLLASIGVLAFVAVYAGWVDQLLYGISDRYHAQVLLVTIAVLPAYFLTNIYGSLLTAKGLFTPFIVVVVISVIVNIALNLVWIRPLGALGCGMAALASQSFCAVACLVVGSKAFGLSLRLPAFLFTAGVGALLLLFFYTGRRYDYNTFGLLIIGGILTALIMFVPIIRRRDSFFAT